MSLPKFYELLKVFSFTGKKGRVNHINDNINRKKKKKNAKRKKCIFVIWKSFYVAFTFIRNYYKIIRTGQELIVK